MSDPTSPLRIGADGIEVEKIVEELKTRVAEKRARGLYDDARVARAEKHNLLNLRDDDEFLETYLACLRKIVTVDINDFEIFERRPRFAKTLIRLKRGIWSLLRFYTFRLWSQQNQTNAVLLAAIEILNTRSASRIQTLEQRIRELEERVSSAAP